MTSSDDQPRYRRGSKRRPKPPKTPPGLVQLEHPSLAVAHFDGKGRGYAAVAPILASSLLLQERPLTVTGAFDSAQDARKALAKIVCDDDEYAHLRGTPEERGRGEGRVKAEGSPGPSSVSGDVWLATLARLANSPFVRVTRVGKANGGDDGSKDLDTAKEQVDGKDTYAARLLARVSTCNHSCRPNAAVSVSDDLVTLYSLRRIEAGEEITVSYGTSLLWLPLQMRRTQLARVWGFVCKCQRCEVDLHRAMAERERAHGTMRRVASRHGFRERFVPDAARRLGRRDRVGVRRDGLRIAVRRGGTRAGHDPRRFARGRGRCGGDRAADERFGAKGGAGHGHELVGHGYELVRFLRQFELL